MKEIVGARIGSIITADVGAIRRAFKAGKVTDFLDRETMRFMSNLDLGKPCAVKGSGKE